MTTTTTSLLGELTQQVTAAAEKHGVPGVAVGVLVDGEEQYVHHGVTSVENPLPVDASTLFQIGSTTKVYTATTLMRLVEQGRLSLDDRVRDHIPSLRLQDESVAAEVRIRHLVTHTAGWLGDTNEETGDGDDALARFVERLAGVPQVSPLGSAASYNNSALNLAGRVIEVVTGQRYEDAVCELVLRPLGMDDSWFFAKDVMTRRFAAGHRARNGVVGVARPWALPRASHPAGGITSTAADQLRFARFHLGDGTAADGTRLLEPATVARMQEPLFSLAGGALGDWVGISWLMRDVDGVRVVGHGGSMNGQQSSFDLVPERNFAITVLTNADSGTLLHREIVDWAFGAYLGLRTGDGEPLPLGPDELAEYAGDYDAHTAIVHARVDGDRLLLGVEYTEAGRALILEVLGEEPPAQAPIPVRLLSPSVYVVVEGEAAGMKGAILRNEDGGIRAIEVGGRLAHRR